jgi:hypothetical protein
MQVRGTTVPVTHRMVLPINEGEGRAGSRGTFRGATNHLLLCAQFQRWFDVW